MVPVGEKVLVPIPMGIVKIRTARGAIYELNVKGTCFVLMGFAKKTDFETGRTLDLNKTYQDIIKPAVEAAGLKCVRADEIVHSRLIDLESDRLEIKLYL